MITVRSKPQYFNAFRWDGQQTKVNDDFEIILLDSVTGNNNLPVGVIIKHAKPVANITQGWWMIFNREAMQIIEDDAFRSHYTEQVVTEAEWTTIALVTPLQSNE